MEIEIPIQNILLKASLEIPSKAYGLIIFAHGTGSGRMSVRNVFVAEELNKGNLATLLFDLLTEDEEKELENRFNIDLLTERLIAVTKWCMENEKTNGFKIGYFGASTGSAAALSAAAFWGTKIGAVVSRGGRPDLAMDELDLIEAPVLLIVGSGDKKVIELNRKAYVKIGCAKKVEIMAGATHLFEEEGALEKVAELAENWFKRFLLDENVKERVAPISQENRTKEIAEESSPEIANERNTIKTTGKGNNFTAELRNKTTKKKKPN